MLGTENLTKESSIEDLVSGLISVAQGLGSIRTKLNQYLFAPEDSYEEMYDYVDEIDRLQDIIVERSNVLMRTALTYGS